MTQNLPVAIADLNQEGGLNKYLQEIRRFPMLSSEEEYMLAKSWLDHGDQQAAHKLVTSHLRLVAKIASGFRGYGLPMSELISEGNIGLMQAVKKFDVERGFRLSTYAMWWIRASIQEYILRSWSLVKIGTTAAQKKLFFNLKRMKSNLNALEDRDLAPDDVATIAKNLMVEESDVISMNSRLSGGDASLNMPLRQDSTHEGEWMDMLEDDSDTPEQMVSDAQIATQRHGLLHQALTILNPREQKIIAARRLDDPIRTLEDLSQEFSISRERVRQIESRAFEKLQKHMLSYKPKTA